MAPSGRATLAMVLLLASALPVCAQDAVVVKTSIKDHRFQPAEIKAPAGKPIVLLIENLDASPEEFESKTLRVERVIPGNSEGRIQLRALQPGRYKFFGDFHEATAQGVLVVD